MNAYVYVFCQIRNAEWLTYEKNITIFYSHLVNCKIKFIKNYLTFDVIAIWMRKYNWKWYKCKFHHVTFNDYSI